jgi:hypothetical protein
MQIQRGLNPLKVKGATRRNLFILKVCKPWMAGLCATLPFCTWPVRAGFAVLCGATKWIVFAAIPQKVQPTNAHDVRRPSAG